jgi:hypothetical protein
MKQFRFVILFCLLLVLASGAAAQPEGESTLLEMLSRVPAIPANRDLILFTDFTAIETAYAPAERPEDWAEYQAWSEAQEDTPEGQPTLLWWVVFSRLSSGQAMQSFRSGGDTVAAIGFDLLEIDQELDYGSPPEDTRQLVGAFDLDSVRRALEERGYEQEAREGVELWCGEAGCEAAVAFNPEDRNPANPFGGDLGRAQPLLINDNVLISSPSAGMIEEHIEVAQGEQRSLGETSEYQAAISAMTSDGVLLQALFVDGETLLRFTSTSPVMTAMTMAPGITEEQVRAILERLIEDYETLPQFTLLGLADVVTETEQQARLILIYNSREDAERAAEVLPERIAAYESLMVRRSMTELLAERYVEDTRYEVVEAANRTALVVTFAGRKGTPEEIAQFSEMLLDSSAYPPVAFPGALFSMFSRMVYSVDLGWLSTVPRSELEALLTD